MATVTEVAFDRIGKKFQRVFKATAVAASETIQFPRHGFSTLSSAELVVNYKNTAASAANALAVESGPNVYAKVFSGGADIDNIVVRHTGF